jgi:Chloroplast import apparatus Tic20-like
MSWQSSQTAADRFFGGLPYLLPIIEVFSFGIFIFQQFPVVAQLYLPLTPLMVIYGAINGTTVGGFGVGSLIFFLILYLGVVTNPRIHRFIRFNTLQAILIGILLSLCGIILSYVLLPLLGIGSAAHQVISNIIFLGTIAMSVYGIICAALGKYTEIPQLSETAQMQIDRY